MGDDYTPVIAPDEEDEQKRLRDEMYPPVSAPAPFAASAPTATAGYPAVESTPSPDAMESGASTLRGMTGNAEQAAQTSTPKPPSWKDYAPAQRHGWGKFGSIMATLNPISNEIVNNRPLRNAERNYGAATKEFGEEQAVGKEQSTQDVQAATAENLRSEVKARENPQPKVGQTPEEQFMNDALHGENGQPKKDAAGNPYNYLSAHQAWKQTEQDVKPEVVAPAHITYDSGIPVSVTGADKKTYDINDPKLPPELKPLVESASRAHGQHVSEEATKTAAANAEAEKRFQEHQEALTNTTKSMIEQAPGVLTLANRVKQLVAQQKDSLGPASGRWSEFMTGKVGAPNPEFAKLRTDVGLLTTKLMRMHVGARGGELIMQHFKDLVDSGKQSPENMQAALDEIIQYAQDTQGERQNGAGKPAAGGGQGGGQPSNKKWNAVSGRYE